MVALSDKIFPYGEEIVCIFPISFVSLIRNAIMDHRTFPIYYILVLFACVFYFFLHLVFCDLMLCEEVLVL